MELEARGKGARARSSSLAGDWLSSLPDCLIHHIMSFLKARQVVQTCVLSTRWRYLWRSVPCLDIDQEEFVTAGPNSDTEEDWHNFEDFTDHLLIPNNISITLLDTFQLHVRKYRSRQAARWIRHGINYSAREPGIHRQGLASSPWCLKRLHLSNVSLDNSFVKHASSGCQCLEDLELKGCYCIFHEITSQTLKNLILKNCHCVGFSVITSPMLEMLVIDGCQESESRDCLLDITAPAIAYLHLSVHVWRFPGGVLLNGMPFLVRASICLYDNIARQSEPGDGQFKLLDSVSNAMCLHLSEFKAMAINEQFPEFQNLRTLLLEKCDLSDSFQTLGHFLHHSPNLEKLTLRHCKFSKDPKKKKVKGKFNKGWLNQLDVRCENLKLTEIIYKDDDVQKLVELLLRISRDLPKNNIKLTMDDDSDSEYVSDSD